MLLSHKEKPTHDFPPLGTCCKNKFPFTLACPSFVYPADYLDNVRHLAPFVDEIQLLFFESQPESLPSRALIRKLSQLADSQTLTYNVHLPSDVYLGHPDPAERRRVADTLRMVLERCEPLDPSTYTLHLNRHAKDLPTIPIARWQTHLVDTLEHMLPPNINPRRISVETLDYPLEQAAAVIAQADLSVCMDMGHLMVHGFDIKAFFERWKERITIVHLHGVDGGSDHLPLNRLANHRMKAALDVLRSFSGVVSLEVYSYPGLNASLMHLVDRWLKLKTEGI